MNYIPVNPSERAKDSIHAAVLAGQAQAAERQRIAKLECQKRASLAAIEKKKRKTQRKRQRRRKR